MVCAGSSQDTSQPGSFSGEDALASKAMPAALQQHLNCAKALSTTDLQTLATQQLEDAVERSATADLLTGYHFTDGRRRIIVVEGLARGAMHLLFEVEHLIEPA